MGPLTKEKEMEIRKASAISSAIMSEAMRAFNLHGPFNSAHEGYAVILEELEELWSEIKQLKNVNDQSRNSAMYKEAIQIGAMALRFVYDVTG
jgi:hypothetical protein